MLKTEFLVYDFDSGQERHNALALTGVESDLGFVADEDLIDAIAAIRSLAIEI